MVDHALTHRSRRAFKPLRSIQLVLPIVRHHHEKQDGSGDPNGLSGADIPLLASVMHLVDVFDALTTDRPIGAPQACLKP